MSVQWPRVRRNTMRLSPSDIPNTQSVTVSSLKVPTLDHKDRGIHYTLAACLCSIVADNWVGFFSLTPDGGPIKAGRMMS